MNAQWHLLLLMTLAAAMTEASAQQLALAAVAASVSAVGDYRNHLE